MTIPVAALAVTVDGRTKGADQALDRLDRKVTVAGKSMGYLGDVGKSALGTFGGFVAADAVMRGLQSGIQATVGSAISFESAFAGVKKTVDGTPEQLDAIRQGIIDMANSIPASREEIAGIAEAAGQLGIQTDNVIGFTRVMVDLGNATNLSGEEAATALARLANITQMSQDDFGRLGSSIVALGNNFATTEAEIVSMGLRIAGAGSQIGMSEADILGLAAALSSVGIEAEAGGTAISKVMIDIASSAAGGAAGVQQFADIAGVSAESFISHWQSKPAEALASFIAGLGRIKAEGGDVFGTLESIGVTEVRMRDALLRSSGAGDLLTRSLSLSTEAWRENNALTKEAEQRYATAESRLQVLSNRVTDVGRQIGEFLVPKIVGGAEALAGLASGGASFLADHQYAVIALGGAFAVSLLPRIVGTASAFADLQRVRVGIWALGVQDSLSGIRAGFRHAETGALNLRGGITNLARTAGPAMAALAGTVVLGLAIKSWQESRQRATEYFDAIEEGVNRSSLSEHGALLERLRDEHAKALAPFEGGEAQAAVRSFLFDLPVVGSLAAGIVNPFTGWADEANQFGEAKSRLAASEPEMQSMVDNLTKAHNVLTGSDGTPIWSELQKLGKAATQAGIDISGPVQTWLPQLQKALAGVGGTTEEVTQQISALAERSDLEEWAAEMRKSTEKAATSMWRFSDEAKQSLNVFLEEAWKNLTAISRWNDNLETLAKEGYGHLIQPFLDLGPDYAIVLDQAIASGGRKLDELGAVFAGFDAERNRQHDKTIEGTRAALEEITRLTADLTELAVHGGIDLGESIATGVAMGLSQSDAITAALNAEIGAALVNAGIFIQMGSPSKLFAKRLGLPMGQGVAMGIEMARPSVDKALQYRPPTPGPLLAATQATATARGTAALVAGANSRTEVVVEGGKRVIQVVMPNGRVLAEVVEPELAATARRRS